MATIVCQGLQTCLEPQRSEPRTLRLKLATPIPQFSQPIEVLALKSSPFLDSKANDMCRKTVENSSPQLYRNPDSDSRSSFQDILKSCKNANDKQEEKVYVHPSMKRSSSCLSEKSLEMCTENLGNETGTEIADSSIFCNDPNSQNSPVQRELTCLNKCDSPMLADYETWEEPKSCKLSRTGKVISRNIPPPLTTLRRSNSLQMRPHREDGRLVIEAVEAASTRTCFEAERIDGRLKLSLVRDYIHEYRSNDGMNGEQEFENQEDGSDQECCMERDVNGGKINVGAEMKMKKFRRPCGGKEGKYDNKGLLIWEPFCAAT